MKKSFVTNLIVSILLITSFVSSNALAQLSIAAPTGNPLAAP